MYPTADDFYGFIFYCDNGDLSQPESVSKKEISDLPTNAGDDGHIYIFCHKCDRFMDYKGDAWVCPTCGESVPKFEPYDILNDMNREFEKELFSDDDDF